MGVRQRCRALECPSRRDRDPMRSRRGGIVLEPRPAAHRLTWGDSLGCRLRIGLLGLREIGLLGPRGIGVGLEDVGKPFMHRRSR